MTITISHARSGTVWGILGDPVGHYDRSSSIMSFDNGTRLFTIQPLAPATEFTIFGRGQRKIVINEALTVTCGTDVGLHYVYFNCETGQLAESTSWPGFDCPLCSFYYWDGAKSLGLADERHGAVMPWVVHAYLHQTIGTRYQGGGDLVQLATGGGGANGDAQISITDVELWDEDIQYLVVRSAAPSAPFEQELGFSTTTPGQIPVFYRTGADGHWTADDATTFPMRPFDGQTPGPGNTARPGYNLDTAGTWSVADPGQNKFIAMFIYGTNNQEQPIIAIMGQRFDNNRRQAEDNNTVEALNLGDFPFVETKVMYRLIIKVNDGYANDINGYIYSVQDLRSISNLPAGQYNPTSHNALGDRGVFPTHPSTSIQHEVDATPATGELGQLIWDTSAVAGSELKVWDGTGWKIVTYTP